MKTRYLPKEVQLIMINTTLIELLQEKMDSSINSINSMMSGAQYKIEYDDDLLVSDSPLI